MESSTATLKITRTQALVTVGLASTRNESKSKNFQRNETDYSSLRLSKFLYSHRPVPIDHFQSSVTVAIFSVCGSWRLQNETSSSWLIELLLSPRRWLSILYYENDERRKLQPTYIKEYTMITIMGICQKIEFRHTNGYWCQGLQMVFRGI